MFQYQYSTNDGKSGYKVLAEGHAQFMINKVIDKDDHGYPLKDNGGCPKFLVELKAKDSMGDVGLIEEQFSGSAKASWKIGELLESIGMGQEYNQSGQLDLQKLIGKRGRAIIYVNSYTKKNGSTGQNMKVREFLKPEAQLLGTPNMPTMVPPPPPVAAYHNAPVDEFEDQTIPF